MNIIIMFILNILVFSLSYTSSQNDLSAQRNQSRAGSIRNINDSNSLRQTPIFAQGETPLFEKDFKFFQIRDTPINIILIQSIVTSPISPDFELILEEVFNEYFYSHPYCKISFPKENEEKKRNFILFLNFSKIDNNFFKCSNDKLFENFCQIYKIPLHQDLNEQEKQEFQKYIKHEEAKEKIRQKHRIEKIIDSFIEEDKKSETP